MGRYIVFRLTRATKQLAIDKVTGGTDVETVLRFKNPVHRPSLPSPDLRNEAQVNPLSPVGIMLE